MEGRRIIIFLAVHFMICHSSLHAGTEAMPEHAEYDVTFATYQIEHLPIKSNVALFYGNLFRMLHNLLHTAYTTIQHPHIQLQTDQYDRSFINTSMS